jgi:hypothetical protein
MMIIAFACYAGATSPESKIENVDENDSRGEEFTVGTPGVGNIGIRVPASAAESILFF